MPTVHDVAPRSLADVVRKGALKNPDAPAFVTDEAVVSYGDMDRVSNRIANLLRSHAVAAGGRVAFVSTNRVEYYQTMFAAAKVGAAMVPVNWRLSEREIRDVILDAKPSIIFFEDGFADALQIGATQYSCPTVRIPSDYGQWTAMLGDHADDDDGYESGPDDPMWLIYTSGTTGAPKGVVLSHGNFFGMAEGLADAWHFDPGCVVYVPYPIFHAVGTAWPTLTMMRLGTVVFRKGFDEMDFLRSVGEYGVTLTMMVPAVLNMILHHPAFDDFDLSSLAHIVYGAAPISQAVLAAAAERLPGCRFTHAYGLTEGTGTVATMQWEEHIPGTERMNSCGRPFPWVEMKMVDPETLRDLGPREVGEVWVRGGIVMKGYFEKPEETAATVVDGGWLRTGDAGYVDEDGYLYLTDRVKDMIISGGENIFPAEVENVVYSFPGVKEAAVVGVPHEKWGEAVLAIVVPKPGAEIEPDSLVAHCRANLAHYKCPSRVEIRHESLPLNATGKVLRRDLKAPYWAGNQRQI